MIFASKTTFSHYNLKILRPEVTKNIKNLHIEFCEFRTSSLHNMSNFKTEIFFRNEINFILNYYLGEQIFQQSENIIL